jgi:hypothetical protein
VNGVIDLELLCLEMGARRHKPFIKSCPGNHGAASTRSTQGVRNGTAQVKGTH